MAVFKGRKAGRKNGADPKEAGEFVDDLDEADRAHEDALIAAEIEAQERAVPAAPRERPTGPWDVEDAPADDDEQQRLDLGGMVIPLPPDTEVRVDVSQEGVVVAATLVHAESSVQVNAFAAPRSEGIWPEVLAEIADSLREGGGTAEQVQGELGLELSAVVPTQVEGAGLVMAPARFVGVDGPRWFLRALFTGPAARDAAAAAPLEAALRAVVVRRGTDPMAVRDPLPLHLPADVEQARLEAAAPAPDLSLAERGPEITEVR